MGLYAVFCVVCVRGMGLCVIIGDFCQISAVVGRIVVVFLCAKIVKPAVLLGLGAVL